MAGHVGGSPTKSSSSENKATPDSLCETVVSQVDEQESRDDYSFSSAIFKMETSRYVWAFTLGAAGLFDILGTVLPGSAYSDTCSEPSAAPLTPPLLSFVAWLDRHDIAISFFVSGLWFLDAFWNAHRAKHKVRAKIERDSLMLKEIKPTKWWNSSSFAYYRSIVVQLLCLPVGFYVAVFYTLYRIIHGEEIEVLDEVNETIVVVETDSDGTEHYETFSVRSKKAFVVALLHYFGGATTQAAMRMVKSELVKVVKAWSKIIFGKAIRNPFKFRRQVKKVLTWIRYLMYGFPLFGKFNKIKGLVTLALKRQRQRREAIRAKRARQLLWEGKPPKVRKEQAAIMIQSAFRARQARKALKALRIFRANEEYVAISKIQHVLRRKLRERRAHLEKKKEELRRLEQMENMKLSDQEKLRMYELRDELVKETKELINRRMLIRPNTKFAVYWKLFFAVCLLWELANFAVKPWLGNDKTKSSDLPSTMEELIAQTFVPTRVSELPQCQSSATEDGLLHRFSKKKQAKDDIQARPWYCHEPYSIGQEAFRDVLALALIPAPVSEWPECQPPKSTKKLWQKRDQDPPSTWYCQYDGVHKVYRRVVDFFWNEFVVLVGVAYFWDVFVTFFTGEFHPKNGVLIPKAFFQRWITPGLVIQLLVNPYMKTVSTWTFETVSKILEYGPVRVYRWNATVVFPLVYFVSHLFVIHMCGSSWWNLRITIT